MRTTVKARYKDFLLAKMKAKAPNMPIHCLPIKSFSDKTANGLEKMIVEWINGHGYQAERIKNTGRMLDNRKTVTDVCGFTKVIGSTQWIKGTGTNGTSDISATIKGRSVKIEVKIKNDKQSEAQKQYEKAIVQAGGVYLICKSFDDFIDWWDIFTIV